MTVTVEPTLARYIRNLPDSRPPVVAWARPAAPVRPPDQPPLDLGGPVIPVTLPTTAAPERRHVVAARWTARPRPDLPDAVDWSASLAMSVMQALLLQRAASQLSRWLEEDVLDAISTHQRRRRAAGPRPAVPITVYSVRVQHPRSDVAEVAAHLTVGRRRTAMAFRLVGQNDRWLCTALELGPRVVPD